MRQLLILKAIFISALILSIAGCDKDEPEPTAPTTTTTTPPPSRSGSTFIRGKVDGTLIDGIYENGIPSAYNAASRWWFAERDEAPNKHSGWRISVNDINLDSISYPHIVKKHLPQGINNIYIEYEHYNPNHSVNYYVGTYDTLTAITLLSWQNDTLVGTFEGTLLKDWLPDSAVAVTEGTFKVKLQR